MVKLITFPAVTKVVELPAGVGGLLKIGFKLTCIVTEVVVCTP